VSSDGTAASGKRSAKAPGGSAPEQPHSAGAVAGHEADEWLADERSFERLQVPQD
jgi:hypothetical protein